MFVDASAIVAILAFEDDWRSLRARMDAADTVLVSPLCIWEAVIALTRTNRIPPDEAEGLVDGLLRTFDAETIAITPETGQLALDAFRRFGRGRHPAALNFGDCFAYASAAEHNVPLLFKGDDLSRTDIAAA